MSEILECGSADSNGNVAINVLNGTGSQSELFLENYLQKLNYNEDTAAAHYEESYASEDHEQSTTEASMEADQVPGMRAPPLHLVETLEGGGGLGMGLHGVSPSPGQWSYAHKFFSPPPGDRDRTSIDTTTSAYGVGGDGVSPSDRMSFSSPATRNMPGLRLVAAGEDGSAHPQSPRLDDYLTGRVPAPPTELDQDHPLHFSSASSANFSAPSVEPFGSNLTSSPPLPPEKIAANIVSTDSKKYMSVSHSVASGNAEGISVTYAGGRKLRQSGIPTFSHQSGMYMAQPPAQEPEVVHQAEAANDDSTKRRPSEVLRKHALWLDQLADQNRKNKLEEVARIHKEARRRERMQEKLLARARQRTGEENSDLPIYAKETTAARTWKVEPQHVQEEDEEEREKHEAERVAQVAALRRHKKEQHRQYLQSLIEKRKVEALEKEREEERQKEARDRVRRQAAKQLQAAAAQAQSKAKEDSSTGTQNSQTHTHNNNHSHHSTAASNRGTDKNTGGQQRMWCSRRASIDHPATVTESAGGVGGMGGGGIVAVRGIRRFSETDVIAASLQGNGDNQEGSGVRREADRERKEQLKKAKQKAQQYLDALKEKKAKVESEEENAKHMAEKRAAAIRRRLKREAEELKAAKQAIVNNTTTDADSIESGEKGVKLTAAELHSSVARLTQRKQSDIDMHANDARDFADWKRRRGLPPDTKVFVMTGWYPCVKQALQERGWHFNPDRASPFFDLRWSLHSNDTKAPPLQPWQLCNHFVRSVALTTKAGLLESMKALPWHMSVDVDTLFPRGYNLSTDSDLSAFIDDFRVTAAVNLLKHILLRVLGRKAVEKLYNTNNNRRHSEDSLSGSGSSEDPGEDENLRKSHAKRGTKRDKHSKESSAEAIANTDINTNTNTDNVVGISETVEEGSSSVCVLGESECKDDVVKEEQERPEIDQSGDISSMQAEEKEADAAESAQDKEGADCKQSSPIHTHTHDVNEHIDTSEGHESKEEGNNSSAFNDSDIDSDDQTMAPARINHPNRARLASARLRPWFPEGDSIHVNSAIVDAALNILEKKLRTAGSSTGLDDQCPSEMAVTDIQWELICLATDDACDPDYSGLYKSHKLPSIRPQSLQLLQSSDTTGSANQSDGARTTAERKSNAQAAKQERVAAALRSKASEVVSNDTTPLGSEKFKKIQRTLAAFRKIHVQYDMDGMFGQNVWIVKPAAKSRGRGIACFTDLPALLQYTEIAKKGFFNAISNAGAPISTAFDKASEDREKSGKIPGKGGPNHSGIEQFIVQKYMENPMLIARRKFDIRQWVLVTDWNPLTVYYCEDCYLRFGVEEYSTSSASLGNAYVHLVNNSIGKYSENFGQVATADNGIEVHEHMWSSATFSEYLNDIGHHDAWSKELKPKMKEIAIGALLCAQEAVEHRKNSWELYGYDFMIDDKLGPWLIEINSSPACDYSTQVTEKFVQAALLDVLKVTVDARQSEDTNKTSDKPAPIDTGLWQLIYKGTYLPTPVAAFGTEMVLKGTRLVRPSRT